MNSGYQADDRARASYHYTHVERHPLVFLAVVCENSSRRRRADDPEVTGFLKRVTATLRLENVLSLLRPDQ